MPHHADIWGSRRIAPPIIALALDRSDGSASCPGCFTSIETPHDTHWIGGWEGPWDVLDAVVKRNTLAPARDQILTAHLSSLHPSNYANWNIPAPNNNKTEAEGRNITLDMRNWLVLRLYKSDNPKTIRKIINESSLPYYRVDSTTYMICRKCK
jgi:hypothetical protein